MRTSATALAALLLSLLATSLAPAFNPGVVIMDGDFVDWSWSYLLEGGVGACSATLNETGGNPDAFFEISTASGWELNAWVVLWKNGVMWDPSDGCEIDYIVLQIDEKALDSFGGGQNIKLLVVQDGKYYVAPLDPWNTGSGIETTWETHVFDPCYYDDFGEIPPWPPDDTSRPDFTQTGGFIKFGFAVGVSSVLDARIHAYDNWKVTIECSPCPVEEATWGSIKALYN
jgi:hypothetical protein